MMTHFYRVHPDLTREVVNLENIYHGPGGSACFLAGGSPALTPDVAGVAETIGIPVFGMNKVCEQVWCDFLNVVDEAWRFNPGPFLSAKCMTFAPFGRWDNLVPGTTRKLCECPAQFFYDLEPAVEYHDFLHDDGKIPWWNDVMIASIAVAYWLGFRRLYLIGVSLTVDPDQPYCYDEPNQPHKNNDRHYFELGQRLRLLRSTFERHGLEIVSCTQGSVLNDYYEFVPAEVVQGIEASLTPHPSYSTTGSYTRRVDPALTPRAPMVDMLPPNRGVIRTKRLRLDLDADLPADAEGLSEHHRQKFDALVAQETAVREKLERVSRAVDAHNALNPDDAEPYTGPVAGEPVLAPGEVGPACCWGCGRSKPTGSLDGFLLECQTCGRGYCLLCRPTHLDGDRCRHCNTYKGLTTPVAAKAGVEIKAGDMVGLDDDGNAVPMGGVKEPDQVCEKAPSVPVAAPADRVAPAPAPLGGAALAAARDVLWKQLSVPFNNWLVSTAAICAGKEQPDQPPQDPKGVIEA